MNDLPTPEAMGQILDATIHAKQCEKVLRAYADGRLIELNDIIKEMSDHTLYRQEKPIPGKVYRHGNDMVPVEPDYEAMASRLLKRFGMGVDERDDIVADMKAVFGAGVGGADE